MSTQLSGRAQESWALKSLCEVASSKALCVGLLAYVQLVRVNVGNVKGVVGDESNRKVVAKESI
jgi:hypothetical protein